MRSTQRPSSVRISGTKPAAVISTFTRLSDGATPIRSEMSIFSARASPQTVASVGFVPPRSICESIERDTPEAAASASSVMPPRLRNCCTCGPIEGTAVSGMGSQLSGIFSLPP